MQLHVPGVFDQEEHLAGDDEAADVEEQALQLLVGPISGGRIVGHGAIHCGEDQEEYAHRDSTDAENEERMGWTNDFDVEAVGGVPPVVEWRRGDHGDAAPGCDEGAEGSTKAEDVY